MKINDLLSKLREYQSFFISSVIAVVLFWLFQNYLIPNGTKIGEMLTMQNDLIAKEKILTKKLEDLGGLDEVEELLLLRKVNAVIPQEKDIFSIFSGLDTQQADAGVVVTQSDFTAGVVSTGSAAIVPAADNKPYKSLDVSFAAIANKENFLTLLNNLESFKTRLFIPHDVKISFVSPDTLDTSFILTTYYLPFPPQLGTLETPLPQLSGQLARIKDKINQNATAISDAEPIFEKGKSNLFQ